jgi:5-methylcytosine-specific restriction endonuclease McrA
VPKHPASPCRLRRCPSLTEHASGFCAIHRAEYDKRRGSPESRGYDRAWRKLSKQVIKEEPLCRRCRLKNSVMTDHILPKRLGGTDARSNLQALCKDCHDEKTRQEDGRFTGAPTSRVVLVAGPPGSGKAAYLATMFRPGDLIVDVDRLFVALSGLEVYQKPGALLTFALEARDAVLRRLAKPSSVGRAWITAGAPTAAERERFERTLSAQVLVLETPAAECLRRIAKDPRRGGSVELWAPVVRDWWSTYRRRSTGDTLIPWQELAA